MTKRKVDSENRAFQSRWEAEYSFTNIGGKPVCIICGDNVAWWNNEVKDSIFKKKVAFKKWITTKSEQDYITYRIARRNAKRTIRASKDESWRIYGEQMATLSKDCPREFYKRVTTIRNRDACYNPTTIINSKRGMPIFNPQQRLARWAEYFQELLNPTDNVTMYRDSQDVL